jgi:hypothetical protein
MNKFRESLLVTHTVEIDKLNDRHRAEMQKFVADGQIKMHDNVLKLKHMHEQVRAAVDCPPSITFTIIPYHRLSSHLMGRS